MHSRTHLGGKYKVEIQSLNDPPKLHIESIRRGISYGDLRNLRMSGPRAVRHSVYSFPSIPREIPPGSRDLLAAAERREFKLAPGLGPILGHGAR